MKIIIAFDILSRSKLYFTVHHRNKYFRRYHRFKYRLRLRAARFVRATWSQNDLPQRAYDVDGCVNFIHFRNFTDA